MDARARHLLHRALSAGRTREALVLAERAVAEDASDGEAVALAAMAEAELGRWDAACQRLVATTGTGGSRLWLRDAALLLIRRAPAGEVRMALAQRLSTGVPDPSGILVLAHAECLVAAGRFEHAAASVVAGASAEARMLLASRLATAGERLRTAGDGGASAALDAALRLLPPGSAPEAALRVAQLAASLGRFGDAIGQLREAAGGIASLAGGEAILTRIFNAACDAGELEAAEQALDLMPSPPEPMRIRCAVALVEAGRLDAAARLAGALTTPGLRAEMAERLLRAAGDGPLLPLIEGLLRGPGLAFSAIMRLLRSAAFRRDLALAAPVLEAAPLADAIERALCRAALAWAKGDLPLARAQVREVLAEAPEDPRALSLAFEFAIAADDLVDAGALAIRLAARLGDEDLPPHWWRLCCAMVDAGDEGQAYDLVGRIQRVVAGFRGREASHLPSFCGSFFHTALCFFDLQAARSIASAYGSDRRMTEDLKRSEQNVANNAELAFFVRSAAQIFKPASRVAKTLEAAELAIAVAPALIPAFTTDQAASAIESVEPTRGRQALSRVLSVARGRGLKVGLVPAPGKAVPTSILRSGKPFVAYHSYGDLGRGCHVKAGSLPDTLLIDPSGYAGWASVARQPLASLRLDDVDAVTARQWRLAEMSRLSLLNHSTYEQKPRVAAPMTQGPSVLVALQVPSDTVMRHAWLDMFELTRAVVQLHRSSGVAVLIKRHPRCADPRTDVLLREVESEPHVTITDASIHDLFAVVKAIYCVNSGVGAEALLYGLPVHISGLTDYRHVCHEIHQVEDIRADDSAFRLPVDETTFDRYVYWYRNIHHVPLDQPGALDAAIEERILRPALARRDGTRH